MVSLATGFLKVACELVEVPIRCLTFHLAREVHEVTCLQQVGSLRQPLSYLQVGLTIKVGSLHITQGLGLTEITQNQV